MPDERATERSTWIRQISLLALLTAGFHILQFLASAALWVRVDSPVIAAFGLDAVVSGLAAGLLSYRIRNSYDKLAALWRSRVIGYGYIIGALLTLYLGIASFLVAHPPQRSLLGIVLAAVSMLVIPIAGSYMKVLAVELRNQTLKDAAVFTFGNSYLSMVLLIALLLNAGMDFSWGDAVGALVMVPFLAQKGIQILIEEGRSEYVED